MTARPTLGRAQLRAYDRRAVEEYGLPSIVLMENAARAAAGHAKRLAGSGRIVVVAGGGNNGGDGWAMARHLANAGHAVAVLAAKPVEELSGDARTMADVWRNMAGEVRPATPESVAQADAALIVDALLGTGLTSPPRPAAAALIAAMNRHPAAVLAVDVPSGLDADAGRPTGAAAVRATTTVTFVANKPGFKSAAEWTGEVAVINDIGAPAALLAEVAEVAAGAGRAG